MVTLKEAWNSYALLLQSLKKSAATKKQYNMDGQQFLTFAHEQNYLYVDHQLKNLLQLYCDYLKETYNNINTFNHKIATLRGFVEFIFLREWVEPFDYQHILQPKKRQKEALQVLTNKQVMQIANVWPTYFQYAKTQEHAWLARRNGCIVQVLMETGCKPAELVRMKWAHLNEEKATLFIANRNGRREIKCSPILMDMLTQYKKETTHLHEQEVGEWVWVSEASLAKPITTKTVERIFQTMSQDIGKNVRATDLRYTVMQRAFQQEKTLEHIQQEMGYVRKWVLTERQQRLE
ncbi:site-specific integrase [Lysinibacillus capsici]|uniref:Site-specific integrase n=1 Tax=Lysinibacillus capsici TaxID=2115968 RepID=A0ABY8KJW7_9BACI|nr:site-specific integrase [Lysinibacillus capsici]MDP1393683.1 site-specific integrase [Lysinibacillus capsici]MDP1414118.1 site-specific integrase [Lysinibacillus capsici]MDP1430007.1 site-specific integrase [Lysinibacillus capsici]WGF39242.1 site-specific integrase [Lysinibacillus capsici]